MKRDPATWMVAKAIALYYYNTNAHDWAIEFQKRIGHQWHPGYLQEALNKYQTGFQSHFGELDYPRQLIMLEMILDKYQGDVEKEFGMVSAAYKPCEDCGEPTLRIPDVHTKCDACTAARQRYLDRGE